MPVFENIDALKQAIGQDIGHSDWVTLDQNRINMFAEATGDRQWIHVDVERAKRESPWGSTIAHGYLTLSMIGGLVQQVFTLNGTKNGVNYGLDRVRFTAPVPAGQRVRLRMTLRGVEPAGAGSADRWQIRFECKLELENSERPACIAETIFVYTV